METWSAVQPVVVGVDGSEVSLTAVDWAAVEAQRRLRTLRVVHVFAWPLLYIPLGAPFLGAQMEALREGAEQIAQTAVRRAEAAAPGLGIESSVVEGAVNPVLVDEAGKALLTVVGSRGLGGVGSLLLGSTGVELAARAAGPVVVVRGEDRRSGRIVVGVDDSPGAMAALEFGFEEAALREARLVIIHADRWPAGTGDHAFLRETARLRARLPSVPVELITPGIHPAEALVNASVGADLLVVGSRGMGGFRGLLLGSVSQAVLHHADCPVAVVRPAPIGGER